MALDKHGDREVKKRIGKKYKSDAMAAIHETMEALHRGGVIDKEAMRRFDEPALCQPGR
jgi:DNA-binding transcriptional regulator YiaG